MGNDDLWPGATALFRYQIISEVLSREARGQKRAHAVKAVAKNHHLAPDGQLRRIGKRTIYRWLNAWADRNFSGLLPVKRKHTQGSVVLSEALLDFFVQHKTIDPAVSVPELIRLAKVLGKVHPEQNISRVTVWRALTRMGIDTTRRKTDKTRDSRRFAYPHRMDMVLCDGKHFRAGHRHLKRVALFYLDDATRKVLNVVVGTSECAQLFLRGLYEALITYGLMSAFYVDRGPGFIALDTIAVMQKLDILFIHGEKAYPEGHGKIERFNRTAKQQVLRLLDGNPEIDPDCRALELRLRHYLRQQYDHCPHEGIDKQTPYNRFSNDVRPLRFFENQLKLRQAFMLCEKRYVSLDNVISYEGVCYEVALGYAGTQILLQRNVLNGSIYMLHEGRLIKLEPVDLHKNARQKRARQKKQPAAVVAIAKGSAQISFEKEYHPVVDSSGNCKPVKGA